MGSSRPDRVIVLDAHLRHSLAVVRSLGRHGLDVVALSPRRFFPAKVSRFCHRAFVFDPVRAGDAAPDQLLEIANRVGAHVVLPAALASFEFLCRYRSRLEGTLRAPYNTLEAFDTLAHKDKTVELGLRLGVACPRSEIVSDPDGLGPILDRFEFPLVFKSTVDQGTVRYAHAPAELRTIVTGFWKENPDLIRQGAFPIVQEYIDGPGHGFYGLGDRGRIIAYFMHRRIHEVPPSGGPSAMAASYYDEELKEQGARFFGATEWTGPAMVEFKKSLRNGRYYLIEVNPKFWGSLDLSISAGVDFPWYLYQLLAGKAVQAVPGEYDRDYVFRWLTMDLAYAAQARDLGGYCRRFLDRRIHDDFQPRDPVPFFVLFWQGIGRFF